MMQSLKILLAAASLLIGLSPAAVNADIYRYTDDNGVVHFTNVNGGGKKHKRVFTESPVPAQTPTSSPRTVSTGPVTSANIPSSYLEIIDDACSRHGVDPSLVHALVKVESDFNPLALSSKGAMGLMQLMPETALTMNVKDSFNPAENIDGGVKYLRYLIDRYEGNLSLALAAYNSGETAVKKWGTIPPFKETQDYVQKILRIYNGGGTAPANYVTRYTTIYMGYAADGSLIVTDNPSGKQSAKFKRRIGKRSL
jgi:hypothetical protein